jgi:protein subunit release factor B
MLSTFFSLECWILFAIISPCVFILPELFLGERSHFANKIKALNRLKAKLLVLAEDLGVTNIEKINRALVENELKHVTRYYMFRPQKLVRDLKTGLQLPDINAVLDGDIEPLIRNHINIRHVR